jgi:hypothetical protein
MMGGMMGQGGMMGGQGQGGMMGQQGQGGTGGQGGGNQNWQQGQVGLTELLFSLHLLRTSIKERACSWGR